MRIPSTTASCVLYSTPTYRVNFACTRKVQAKLGSIAGGLGLIGRKEAAVELLAATATNTFARR